MESMVGKHGYALCDGDGNYYAISTDREDILRYISENEITGECGEYIREGTITEGNLVELESCEDVDMNLYEYCRFAF